MNRLDQCFANLRSSGKKAFVAYICAGDPHLDATVEIVRKLDAAGVDVIELGVPFSDPVADGIVNQMAADRAIAAGATTAGVLGTIRKIREFTQIPIVLFTYMNPVFTYGWDRFHSDAAAAGTDGILVLDLPPDEAAQNPDLQNEDGLAHIRLVAPTTPEQRIPQIARIAQGFIYYVSQEGVTGMQTTVAKGIAEMVNVIKANSSVPVCAGFGISNPAQAAEVATKADGVIVGSAIVKLIERNGAEPDLADRVAAFVKPMVDAVKAV
jgi:tryptophan synthase alpha chain